MTIIQLVLALVVNKNWHLQQLNVDNAFYMVCKLLKSLYGLKLASRQWNNMLITTLIFLGYIQSKLDYFVFVKSITSRITIILVYIDDIVLTRDALPEIQSVKAYLDQKFKIKGLGCPISQKNCSYTKRKYSLELLDDESLLTCKPTLISKAHNLKFSAEGSPSHPDPSSYRRLIDKLLYLTNIRFDLSFSINKLNQFVFKPKITHHEAIILTRIGLLAQILENRSLDSQYSLVLLSFHRDQRKKLLYLDPPLRQNKGYHINM
ncbi:hypothetical protein CR513_62043, partial [Mucuna pruriens]